MVGVRDRELARAGVLDGGLHELERRRRRCSGTRRRGFRERLPSCALPLHSIRADRLGGTSDELAALQQPKTAE